MKKIGIKLDIFLIFHFCTFNSHIFTNNFNNTKGFILSLDKYLAYLIALKLLVLLSMTKYVCFLSTFLCLHCIEPAVLYGSQMSSKKVEPLKRAVILRVNSTLQ